ncbi:NAD(P)/FAD-dependent oxidoreductase [Hoeflea sp. TYP-13]|uniref:NAD(P)/FAD-dependent oxidoreductase n=1 Tax=Hoeflea sp. TYP-13 TaxID=3230023 RepID=UPI0034C67B41
MTEYQVAIIGGGPAGLAAALTLSRSMMRTIVFDSPLPPRNDASSHVGAFPGMDMAAPKDIRETVTAQISKYGYTDMKSAEIASVSADEEGFALKTQGGSSFRARRLLLTTGMIDIFPKIAGISNRWGTSVINCPFCQGFELKNRPWGIYVHRPEILSAAEVYRNWTSDLVMFVEPTINVPQDRADAITALGIELIASGAEALEGPGNSLTEVVLRDGRRVPREVLLIWPHQTQGDLVKTLDLPLCEDGYVEIDECYRTGMAGIYAAGDLTYGGHQSTTTAIHMGNRAATWMVFDLCQTDNALAPSRSDRQSELTPSDLADTAPVPEFQQLGQA